MLQKYREELSLQPTRDCNARASFLDEEKVSCDRNGSFQSAKMLTEKNRSHEVGRSQSSAKSRKLRWLPTSPSGNGRTSMLEVCMYVCMSLINAQTSQGSQTLLKSNARTCGSNLSYVP